MLRNLAFRVLPIFKRDCKIFNPSRVCNHFYKSRLRCSVHLLKPNCGNFNLYSTDAVDQTEHASSVQYNNLTDAEIEEITEGDPELAKVLRVLILEVDILRQDGQLVPDKITNKEWKEMLTLRTRSARIRYLIFLFKNEKKEYNRKVKVGIRQKARLEEKEANKENNHIVYGFNGSTIFVRVYDTSMNMHYNKNLMNAHMFSQHLVFDCSYQDYMTKLELKNCAKQIIMLFGANRIHKEPFHIQFCNASPESPLMEILRRYIPSMDEPSFPFFYSEKSHVDLYPKEKLVYLTPHCRNDLVEYNHDDVYIVGAMVDKADSKPFSLAKAKEHGLRVAKLPLERHLVWGTGSTKSLTLNQMTSILLDMRLYGDWEKAFKHIPRRKLVGDNELSNEANMDAVKYKKKPMKNRYGENEVFLSQNMIDKVRHAKKINIKRLYE